MKRKLSGPKLYRFYGCHTYIYIYLVSQRIDQAKMGVCVPDGLWLFGKLLRINRKNMCLTLHWHYTIFWAIDKNIISIAIKRAYRKCSYYVIKQVGNTYLHKHIVIIIIFLQAVFDLRAFFVTITALVKNLSSSHNWHAIAN